MTTLSRSFAPDRWFARLAAVPERLRWWTIGVPVAVTLVAAVLRLWNIGYPEGVIADEHYYVLDAWSMLHLGYEGVWPGDPMAGWNAGDHDFFTGEGQYATHPPLGKWLIALGMLAFGDNAFGFRIASVVAGVVIVLVVTLLAKHFFASTLVGGLAGLLIAIDGNAIVMSRVAFLDIFVALFALLGFAAVVLDRGDSRRRLGHWLGARRAQGFDTSWGPAIWARPWLITAAVMFGAAAAVKWNGAAFLAFFAVYSVVVDAVDRRRAGVERWALGTLLRQAPTTFLVTAPVALATYLATWAGWFAHPQAYLRGWAADGHGYTGAWAWVPDIVQDLVHNHVANYLYAAGIDSPHPYQSSPLLWPLLQRDVLFFFRPLGDGTAGVVYDLPNPFIWYASVLACLYLVYRLVRYRDRVSVLLLTAIAAGYLPWLGYLDRTVFSWYTIVFEPYLVLALAAVLARILGSPGDPSRRSGAFQLVAVIVGISVAISAYFYPLWTGETVSGTFIDQHFWLPSWR